MGWYRLYLLALFVACTLAAKQDKKKAPSSTAVETTAPKSLVDDIDDSTCICEKQTCGCCAEIKYDNSVQRLCIQGHFIEKNGSAEIDFRHNKASKWKHVFKPDSLKFCPTDLLPAPMDYLRFCMGIYHVDLSTKKNTAELCFYGEFKVIIPVFSVDFHCLRYQSGKITVTYDSHFKRAGVFHLNLTAVGAEFSFNGKAVVKGLYDAATAKIREGLSTKTTKWEKAKFLTESCWEMTPMSQIVEGAKEIAPLLAGAGQWMVTEALDSLKGIAEEMVTEMEGMSKPQKAAYISKQLVLFFPHVVGNAATKAQRLTPFVASVLKFGASKLSRAYDELRVTIAKKLKDWNYQADAIMGNLKKQIDKGVLYGGDVVKGLVDSTITTYKDLGTQLKVVAAKVASLKDELDIPYYLDRVLKVASPMITRGVAVIQKFASDVASGLKAAGTAIKESYNIVKTKFNERYNKTKGWFKSKFKLDRR